MYYTNGIDETLAKLQTTRQGLSSGDAQLRLQEYGPNALPEQRSKSLIELFFAQFKSPIIYVLLAAAGVTFAIAEYTDTYFIMAVICLNAMIGTYQEYSAAQKAKSLKQAIKTIVRVIRNGKIVEIESELLTVGDIVVLESGCRVPADLRLVSSASLLVNESLLTGESLEVHKEAEFLSEEELQVADRKNMLYAGSYVASGRAEGVVTAVGTSSEIGKIAQMLSMGAGGEAPLVIRIRRLSVTLAIAVGAVVLFLLMVGLYRDMVWYEIFIFSVALAVSAIPEGLPVAITVALTSASLAMSKRNVIVRKLAAIEALGSCTLIASDKTGTLTQNQLSVEHFIPYRGEAGEDEDLMHVTHLASILCNEIKIERDAEELTFVGDQVDIALAKHAISADEAYILDADDYARLHEIPYEPQNRYSAVMVEREGNSYEFVKGSPETVLAFCSLDEAEKKRVLEDVDAWAAKGYRNIALAYKRETSAQGIHLEGFTYLGFMAIIDPLRDEALESVKKANEAGISVVMVTGDHPSTAFYIASQLGIAQGPEDVIDGIGLTQWKEAGEDPEALRYKTVFARVNPLQKQQIVAAFQQMGHFVAVTGDGVNDAPALKYANIGIAMGKSGTDIARSTGDIILTDDNFASIVNGIEEGRRAYDNIRKVIYLLVSTGFAEIVLVTLAFLFGMPLPLLPVQLLWLNLVTNGLEDVMLGLEKAEPGLLQRKPRPPTERVFNTIMIRRVVVGGLYMALMAFSVFYLLLEMGYSEYSARNMTLLLMVLFENVHVFNARSEVNYLHRIGYRGSIMLILWVIMTQLLHIGCMHIPLMQEVLSLEPVAMQEWGLLFIVALGLVSVMETEKWHRRRSEREALSEVGA